MKLCPICLLSACMLNIGPALGADVALSKPQQVQAKLECGDATVVARTESFIFSPKKPVMYTMQSMTLTTPKQQITLALDSKPLTQPFYPQQAVLDSIVSLWECVTTHSGEHYIYFLYTCTPSQLRPKCTPDEMGNWDVLLDTTGKKIKRSQYRKLGITTALDTARPLKSVVN